jgi:hypothetical protein
MSLTTSTTRTPQETFIKIKMEQHREEREEEEAEEGQ